MIIDPIDIRMIRQLEFQGSITMHEIIAKFHISRDEILLRIKNFEDEGFISGYGLKLSVPNIIGGRWYLCCAFTEASSHLKPEKIIPFLEEKIENITFPEGVSPNLAFLFYTQDLRDSYKAINKMPGLKFAEIYKVNEYSVALPMILSAEDQQAILELCDMKLNYERIHAILYEPKNEADTQYGRLIWHKKNRRGVVSIYPDLNWNVVKNYAHLHVAVVTKIRSKELRKMINGLGYSANIAAKFKKRFLQLEFDIWGFSDMQRIMNSLQSLGKIDIAGCSFAFRNIVCDRWIKGFVEHSV